ncbi:uncharacterized protein Dwil_GK22867 [Drosophila willistoni]|uniref:Major facilitator superfamily (MFS) profile domain-containing protein n=1 Tax=Drosophila willistoni TaxID=7260 RepID=B4NNM0_DROWI|nr:uncharacterized protein Dwil_GK22867 [Drosophila willistoni]
MNEEPYTHENLVAKIKPNRNDPEASTGNSCSTSISEESLASQRSSNPIVANDTAPTARWGIYLIEPLILILLFAYNFSSTIFKNQVIYQSCTAGLGYPDAVCLLLGTKNSTNETKKIEAEVQPYAARVMLTIKLVECLVPAFCGLFAGAWADRYGRKPLLMASFLGYSMQYLISSIIAYLAMENHGMISPWLYILTIIPLSLLGSSVTYSAAAVCFIGDVSSEKMRSYRLIAYEMSIYVGLLLGSFASGYVYEDLNSQSYIVFAISSVSILVGLFIMMLFLPESLPTQPQVTPTTSLTGLLKDMGRSCCKPRQFKDRSIIILLMCILLLTAFVADGSNSVFYLFMRAQFHWTVKEFTNYESVSILVPALAGSGGMLFLWSLRKCTRNSAILWLAFISLLSHVSSSLMRAFAFVDWQIYVAIGLGALKSLVNPMCRTAITSLLPADERGKIFALLDVVRNLTPFVSSSVYIVIYSLTLSSAPSLFNLFSANFYGLAIALLLVVWRLKSTQQSEHYDPVFR